MKKKLSMSLVVILAGASALWAETGKNVSPMERLSEGVNLIGQGSYDQALTHLLWCYDQGVTADAEFKPVRETSVIDALAFLAEVHPPTIAALKARRDTALGQAGNPPKISAAFFDVLALNRAIGDDAMSDDLIKKAVSAGGVQTFAAGRGGFPDDKVQTIYDAMKSSAVSASPRAMKAIKRVDDITRYAKVSSAADLKVRIDTSKRMNFEDSIDIARELARNQPGNVDPKDGATEKGRHAAGAPGTGAMKGFQQAQEVLKAENALLSALTTWNNTRPKKE